MSHSTIQNGKQKSRQLRPRRGLTLLELVAVVTIVAVLAGIVLPRLVGPREESLRQACFVHQGDIEIQARLWHRKQGAWPATNLSDVGADPAYFPDGLPLCPLDGTAYQLDATTHNVVGHDHP